MIEPLLAQENEYFPNRRRWTVEQCYRLMAAGELPGRWELIDGEVLSKMGQKPPHAFTLLLVAEWLAALFGFRRARMQLPLSIPGASGETNEPEPDIAVITQQAAEFYDRTPGASDALLVVEISDTSLRLDLRTKALLYARSGVPEYWVVDITGRAVHRHRAPSHTGYAEVVTLAETESIAPAVSSEVAIRISELLPPRTGEQHSRG